jgi:hypothetical protein
LDQLYGILGLAVLLGIGYLIQKGKRAASKAINTKIFSRSEHKEGQQLVSQPLVLESSASVSDIMKELTAHVITVETLPTLGGAVVESSRSTDRINYVYGNKFKNHFVAVVLLIDHGATTEGIFKILKWFEYDGIVSGRDVMKKLRKQVKAAFIAADASVKITEETVNDNL